MTTAILAVAALSGQETRLQIAGTSIAGPRSASDFPAWLADVQHWRKERLGRIGYEDSQYVRPEFQWAQSSFVEGFLMVEDRYLYDPDTMRYTVDRYLDYCRKAFGGVDSVLIWHAYPNIGIDSRNQYDLIADMPGGLAGVRQMVSDFHRRSVRVLFAVRPWEQGTRAAGDTDWNAATRLLADIGADGLFGDTMSSVPLAYRAASDRTNHPLVLEPELLEVDDALPWSNMHWGPLGSGTSFVPLVSKYKWLEPRHMMHISPRWNRDRNDILQHMWFNGTGLAYWDSVFGMLNGLTARDAEALRRIATLERYFASMLTSAGWEPHTPTLRFGVFASRFPAEGRTLWTIVNRNEYDVSGPQLRVSFEPGMRVYDLWHGVALNPEVKDGSATLSFPIEAHGFGGVLAIAGQNAPEGLEALLSGMRERARVLLNQLPADWKFIPQQLVGLPTTRRFGSAPAGMVRIPAGQFDFAVSATIIEGENQVGVDVQYPWEDSPRRHHRKSVAMQSFYIDRYPITNSRFKKFLDESHYHPADGHNFVKDWSAGTYPEGWADKPVTWVSIEDARAYCSSLGQRLPHEWEWQYAAQGSDGRSYPWGNSWDHAAVPEPDRGREMPPPADVKAHPRGASPFGVEDLTGNVWQWTDEYVDERTRAAILRGGSHYQPQGSSWYFPQAYKLTEHSKYLLMAPGRDRSAAVGFRCAADAEQ